MILNDDKHHELLSSLFVLTKEDKITWNYLDSEKPLFISLNLTPYGVNESLSLVLLNRTQKFDASNSFYTSVNNNYIVIYVLYSNNDEESFVSRLKLLLVPRTYKSVEEVKCPNEIVRLQTLIKSKFPSPDDIINDIMNLAKQ